MPLPLLPTAKLQQRCQLHVELGRWAMPRILRTRCIRGELDCCASVRRHGTLPVQRCAWLHHDVHGSLQRPELLHEQR